MSGRGDGIGGGGDGREICVDLFAGGGGVSLGLSRALGRGPDYAVNHSRAALALHRLNHPDTHHLNCNVWQVSPTELCRGRRVGLLWASPDCKHHSRAKGGTPLQRNIRDLPWVVVRWAREVAPRVVMLENVAELTSWGPLGEDGRPVRGREGDTFVAFKAEMRRLGYVVEHRVLTASDVGIPTMRRRLFMVMRRDGEPIRWPERTHAAPSHPAVRSGALAPWATAASDVVDFGRPGVSIFATRAEGRALGVKRPLVPATMRRIALGIGRYVRAPESRFIVTCNHGDPGFRGQAVGEPFRTVTAARDAHGLMIPHLTSFHGGSVGQGVDAPMPTVTANSFVRRPGGAVPHGVVSAVAEPADGIVECASLVRHFGQSVGSPLAAPVGSLTAGGGGKTMVATTRMAGDPAASGVDAGRAEACRRFLEEHLGPGPGGLPANVVVVGDRPYAIVDVALRMFDVDELFRAQGFPADYETRFGIDELEDGRREFVSFTKTERTSMCGNAVPPRWAELLARQNYAPRRDGPGVGEAHRDLPLFLEAAE